MKKILLFITLVVMTTGCTQSVKKLNNSNMLNSEEYNWSTMKQGPYNDKVSFATSVDLVNWIDSETTLVEHASVPGAVIKDSVIYVYFVDVSQDGIPEQTGLITSSDDGKTWSEKTICNIDGLGTKVAVDPSAFVLDDGRIRLYYYDISEKPDPRNPVDNKIYSAVSEDGVSFVEEEGVRFMRNGVFDPDVEKIGDTWYMYTGNIEGNQVIVATSNDGLTFEEQGVAYDGGAVPDVFQTEGGLYLYTAGIDIMPSNDPFSFPKSQYHFQSKSGGVTADPSVVQLSDGTYMMLYKTSNSTGPNDPPLEPPM